MHHLGLVAGYRFSTQRFDDFQTKNGLESKPHEQQRYMERMCLEGKTFKTPADCEESEHAPHGLHC